MYDPNNLANNCLKYADLAFQITLCMLKEVFFFKYNILKSLYVANIFIKNSENSQLSIWNVQYACF